MVQASSTFFSEGPNRSGIRVWTPLVRQTDDYTCGVAALQSVLHYYGHTIRADRLAAALKADPEQGTHYRRMATYAESHGLDVTIYTEMEIEALRKLLDRGVPVIVALQAWGDRGPDDYTDEWDDGHYVVAVGYDKERFYFMDPSTLGNYTYIPTGEFLTRWHDCYEEAGEIIRVARLGIALHGAKVHYARDRIIHMK